MDATLIADEFPLDDDLVYLNHAGVAPWPRRTARAVREFAEENVRRGAAGYPRWVAREQVLRGQLRDLIGAASSDDIALLKNTSEGLSFVAAGLDWRDGDNVVSSDQEFPSNRIVWEALAPRGVELRKVALTGGRSPEEALIEACDGRTRLLALSAVQYATGLRMDLPRLGRHCRSKGILFCVDAIQAIGAVPFDIREILADFVVADAHKWMLGPEGIALFYCNPDVRANLALTEYGWHMTDRPGDYDRHDWTPAATAQRFECGSSNMLGVHAMAASLEVFFELGLEEVFEHVERNVSQLMEYIDLEPELELLSPRAVERRAGIVSFRPRRMAAEALFQRLKGRGVVCARRGAGVRFSPHFYTPQAKLAEAMERVREALAASSAV